MEVHRLAAGAAQGKVESHPANLSRRLERYLGVSETTPPNAS
jgi:hypothetical protein